MKSVVGEWGDLGASRRLTGEREREGGERALDQCRHFVSLTLSYIHSVIICESWRTYCVHTRLPFIICLQHTRCSQCFRPRNTVYLFKCLSECAFD